MIRCRPVLIAFVCGAAALSARAGTGPYPITQEQIAAAVTGSGMRVSPDQVSLLADVVSSTARPTLRVQSIQPAGENRVIARMECAQAGQCLPFIVALRPDTIAIPAAAPDQAPSRQQPNAPDLVRAGSSALLLLDGDHVHISLSVRCLENGKLGQTIRATSLDRHQFFMAQVVGDRILRGRL